MRKRYLQSYFGYNRSPIAHSCHSATFRLHPVTVLTGPLQLFCIAGAGQIFHASQHASNCLSVYGGGQGFRVSQIAGKAVAPLPGKDGQLAKWGKGTLKLPAYLSIAAEEENFHISDGKIFRNNPNGCKGCPLFVQEFRPGGCRISFLLKKCSG
jgi:hypothetical protein